MSVSASKEDAIKFGLGEEGRKRLNLIAEATMTEAEFLTCLCPTGRELFRIHREIKVRHAGSEFLAGRLNVVVVSMKKHMAECVKCQMATNLLAAKE